MIIPQKSTDTRITALYERLSRDDESLGESNSILNQKRYLEDYANTNGFRNIRHYTDDGYSGTNFDRPGFNRLLQDVDAGRIGTVIVKDLSRFGRNYLQVGIYTEMKFPEKGVRFIAINNGVDSLQPGSSDFTPFLNIMNEWYAKDTSNKIRAIFQARMQSGKRCSGSIPYGYRRDPEDKNHLIVDSEPAQVVRQIFELAADGLGPRQIADRLTELHILIPSAYAERFHQDNMSCHSYHDASVWNATTVTAILERREYLGHTILGKSICENFKTKKRRKARPEELIVFENTHEAIVSEELWNEAQRMRRRAKRMTVAGTYSHMMSGMVFCADCGSRMSFRSAQSQHRPDGKTYDCDNAFCCSKYKNMYKSCTMHFIKCSALEGLVLDALQRVTKHVFQDEEAFRKEMDAQWSAQLSEAFDADRKELAESKKRVGELDVLIKKLYEGNATGKIPDRQFERLMPTYDEEQVRLEQRITELEQKLAGELANQNGTERFISLCHRYKEITELTPRILNAFIDRIEVHEATGGRGKNRAQKVEIFFTFIGRCIPPVSEEELLAEQEALRKAEQLREEERKARAKATQKRYNEKKRAQMQELRQRAESDPEAAREYRAMRDHRNEIVRRSAQKRKERMKTDAEYAQRETERRKRNNENSYARFKQRQADARADLVVCAE